MKYNNTSKDYKMGLFNVLQDSIKHTSLLIELFYFVYYLEVENISMTQPTYTGVPLTTGNNFLK